MSIVLVVVFLGVLYFLAHAFAGIFSRTKIPDVLWLIIVGLCLGPIFHVVIPTHLGEVGPVFITITLVVILFQSGLEINVNTLLKAWSRGVALTTLNFLVTMIVVGTATFLLTRLAPLSAFMLGAIVGGTSSAVVIPLLHQLKMKNESSAILLLESALTDVLCIVVTLAFLGAHKGNTPNFGLAIGGIIASFLVAIVLGIVGAFLWSIILDKIRTLQNSIFATPAFVFIIFGIAELLGYSGYIAALAFGITIGNMESFEFRLKKMRIFSLLVKPDTLNETEKKFFSEIVFVLKTFFFVYIGLSVQLANSWLIYVGIILTILAFVLRIPVVRFSISKSTPKEDVSLMAVMVPKGLAAATLASLSLQQGIVGGEIIQNVTFAVVLFSITFTSILIFLLHKTALSKLYRRMFSGFGAPLNPPIGNRESTDGTKDNVTGQSA